MHMTEIAANCQKIPANTVKKWDCIRYLNPDQDPDPHLVEITFEAVRFSFRCLFLIILPDVISSSSQLYGE